jgi:hypothetical protein
MPAESVALTQVARRMPCPLLPVDEERWSAYLTDDEPPEGVFYWPECAEREFES